MIICPAVKSACYECWGWREMLNSSILGHGKSSRLQMLRIDWQTVAECAGPATQHIKRLKARKSLAVAAA